MTTPRRVQRGEIFFEVCITFLPIALLFVMFAVFKSADWKHVLSHEEWLFVSAVLQAQAIGKLFIASDHEGVRNKPVLYVAALVLILGILWCSMSVAKHLIFTSGAVPSERVLIRKTFATNSVLGSVVSGGTNLNQPAVQLVEEHFVVANIEEHQEGSVYQNFIAVALASLSFYWAATIERSSQSKGQSE